MNYSSYYGMPLLSLGYFTHEQCGKGRDLTSLPEEIFFFVMVDFIGYVCDTKVVIKK